MNVNAHIDIATSAVVHSLYHLVTQIKPVNNASQTYTIAHTHTLSA